ncbi:COG1361 S-layer family protein [Candidatus Nanosalina sp. VS9-1]|uniref:COG1361 S-layer family protein n=1 Tax=Candidatus Nanosalina sp. VS9-1 TaxID=3388566 RepID=UPI0039E03779
MNKTRLTTLLLLAGLLMSSAAAQQSTRASTNIEASLINSDPVPLQSGEQGDLSFKIVNNGDKEAQNVEVRLLDNYPFELKPDRQRNYSLGDMVSGQEYQISTSVLVADDAPDGSNNFRVQISYGDFSVTRNIPVEVQSEDIELNVANLKTQPQQLMPDTDNNMMSVDIVNNGEKTAENVVLNLYFPGFFQETSSFSTRQALGNIQPGQIKTAEFNFDINETAPAGSTSINGDLQYSAGDSTSEITDPVSFNLYMEGKPQFQITGVESNLRTGNTGELRLEVKNIGAEQSSSTRIRVLDSSDQPFSYDSSSKYIGTLEPGKTGEAVFEVDTESDAAVKQYLVDFETRGVKSTEVFVEDETVQVDVTNGKTEESGIPVPLLGGLIVLIGAGIYIFRRRKSSSEQDEESE